VARLDCLSRSFVGFARILEFWLEHKIKTSCSLEQIGCGIGKLGIRENRRRSPISAWHGSMPTTA
jgi:hypothetical protein